MILSKRALGWVCKRLTDASGIRGKASNNRAVIILPESAFNEGWEKSYKDSLQKTKWTRTETQIAEEGNMLKAGVQLEDKDLLAV
ncbi:hypothetical protein H5410_050819 [Solanum commersonii]|uniref:Uncharacterized protein n=1 Tax=Solanum commersonii TaxID=4109 RepID=A0A9J5WZ40_SOLCO|nr:hypothetical protein H5410_050819 [Solanum commersonii]